jgi:hypothetical protein
MCSIVEQNARTEAFNKWTDSKIAAKSPEPETDAGAKRNTNVRSDSQSLKDGIVNDTGTGETDIRPVFTPQPDTM